MNLLEIGPMVGGVSVPLGKIPDVAGAEYVLLLQYGGAVPSSSSSSSLVNGNWVKNPPPTPKTCPVVTLMPINGGPRATFDAAVFVENARCGLGFILTSLWDDGKCTAFHALDITHLGTAIEVAIPEPLGRFAVQWIAPEDEEDSIPF